MAKFSAQATPVTVPAMALAFPKAWRAAFDEDVSQRTLALLLAHWAHETARGAGMMNYNVGNIKAPSDDSDHCYFQTWERLSGEQARRAVAAATPAAPCRMGASAPGGMMIVHFFPEHPACRFRAYSSLDEGCSDYLALLRRRFTSAWPALLSGSPEDYVRALKTQHYFTADVDQYLASVKPLFNEFFALLALMSDPDRTRALRHTLNGLGYDAGDESSPYDHALLNAIIAFQLANGLTPDDIVGPKTMGALAEAVGAKA